MSAVAAPASANSAPPRRTQAERRAGTVRKLLDGATAALIDLGYANTSVQQICTRAGLSQGALFRHFGSRIELLIAVANDLGESLEALYQQEFLRLRRRSTDELALALKLLRSNVQSPKHQAWFELLMAARTDRTLHAALTPIWRRRDAAVQALAAALLPDAARALPEFPVIVDVLVTLFHGEGVDRFLRADPHADAARMRWLLAQLRPLLEKVR